LDFTPKHSKTKLGVFGEIIVKNTILKTTQRISYTSGVVLPPLKPFKNQPPMPNFIGNVTQTVKVPCKSHQRWNSYDYSLRL
ncbi:hypothetical protein, partial [Vibrio tasmaniensis]|uniref:hypothetical protein n=1 Tax=Vibrio tasmaniensis TaxID=212663 RepID=UPI001A7E0C7F